MRGLQVLLLLLLLLLLFLSLLLLLLPLQVPLERVRLVVAEKPVLLSQSPKVIKEAAAKLPKT